MEVLNANNCWLNYGMMTMVHYLLVVVNKLYLRMKLLWIIRVKRLSPLMKMARLMKR